MIKKFIIIPLFCLFVCAFAEDKGTAPPGYTVNFDNVSIKEFLRFMSKIGAVNIVYNEEELNFNMTFISREETSLENLMSALVQILRINGFSLIEEDRNWLIHRNEAIRQIPVVVSEETPLTGQTPALITRIFKIKKGNPSHLADLITPMLSGKAIVEVATDTQQLIITDVASSINTVEQLLASLDAPEMPYDLDVYVSTNIPVGQLEMLAKKILAPLADNTVLVLVSQPETGSIFIVSTPFWVERTINILQDLDKTPLLLKELSAQNVLIYKPIHKTPEDLDEHLKKIAEESKSQGFSSPTLEHTIESAKFLKSANSLMFIGPQKDLDVIKSFIASIDTSSGQASNTVFFLYEPPMVSLAEMKTAITALLDDLKKNNFANPGLLQTLETSRAIDPINSILFTGSKEAIQEVKALLGTIEASYQTEVKRVGATQFLIYQIKNAPKEQIQQSLTNFADYLENNNYPNTELIKAIDSMRWAKATNSLIFTGHQIALNELSKILPTFDILTPTDQARQNAEFIIYTPKQVTAEQLKVLTEDTVKNLTSAELADPALLRTLESAKVLPSSNQLIFTGDKASLAKLHSVLSELDQASSVEAMRDGPYFIHLKTAEYHKVKNALQALADALPKKDLIREMIDHMKYLPDSNIIVFRGPADAMKRIQEVVGSSITETGPKPSENTEFVTIKHKDSAAIIAILHETAVRLSKSEHPPEGLIATLKNTEVLPGSNTILITGTASDRAKAKELIASNDNPTSIIPTSDNTEFVTVKHKSNDAIVKILHDTATRLSKSDQPPEGLITVLESAEALPNSNVILLTGAPADRVKAKELIASNDNAVTGIPVSEVATTFVNIQNRTASAIVQILHETAAKVAKSEVPNATLIKTLETSQALANTNTVILSGNPQDLAKVRELIAINDTVEKKMAGMNIFIYKLKFLSPLDLQSTLVGIGKHMQAQTSDPGAQAFVQSIDAMHVIPDSSAVQFVGSPDTLQRIKEIITIIDVPDHVKAAAKPGSNVLVYQVQRLNPNELLAHVKQIAKDAGPNAKDTSFITAINTGRYAAGTNSLVFTGDPAALDKLQALLVKLDVPEAPLTPPTTRVAEGYQLYKPQYVPGNDLIQMVKNFEAHLTSVGVSQPPFSETVAHLNYVARTNTIIVSGTPDAVNQVMSLLKEFDNPQAGPPDQGGIETINETGFLIYKLQFQSGFGIVDALQAIGADLAEQAAKRKSDDLVEAIQSVKYIDVTNSLLATGEPRTLTRLKELMESLDRPQKQVFIEILVVNTALNNELDFGLRWGTQGVVENRFAWGAGNFPPTDTNQGFPANFNAITGTRTPLGSDIPPLPGGYLGVIGDVIWHKGKSYAALGPLLNALQLAQDTTVVLSQHIVVQDNQNAKIFSGENVPFTGSIVTTTGLTQQTNANLEYRNIGVTLSLTPLIGDNDLITLDIEEEISQLEAGSTGTSTSTVSGITTTKTSMKTKVNIPDRHFLVLSGTMSNTVTRAQAGIPCLGGLPLVGAAFSQNNKLTTTSNVIIFVKPHIIKTIEIYDQITKCKEELYGNPDYSNPEDYYRGLEIIRCPSDIDFLEEDECCCD